VGGGRSGGWDDVLNTLQENFMDLLSYRPINFSIC
jgi:hypothetical protein